MAHIKSTPNTGKTVFDQVRTVVHNWFNPSMPVLAAVMEKLEPIIERAQVEAEHTTISRWDEVFITNRARSARWHGDKPWDVNKWATAVTGEWGELNNVIKKMNRLADAIVGRHTEQDMEALKAHAAEEAADVILYFDLLMECMGIDLYAATVAKFNKTSEEYGFTHRLQDAHSRLESVQGGIQELREVLDGLEYEPQHITVGELAEKVADIMTTDRTPRPTQVAHSPEVKPHIHEWVRGTPWTSTVLGHNHNVIGDVVQPAMGHTHPWRS